MSPPLHIGEVVPPALDGERVDRAVSLLAGVSRRQAAALVESGAVRVDGVPVASRSQRLSQGDRLDVEVEEAVETAPGPDPTVPVPVVHADDDVVVVDKPAGLVVHPGAGRSGGTLVNGLLARYPEMAVVGDPARPGIVHRLDVGTSGLLVAARSQRAHGLLVRQMAARSVDRRYLALVWGLVQEGSGLVDAPVGRSASTRTRMAVTATGRPSRTAFEVVERFASPAETSFLECRLETGRTHQIRVHLAAIGHPVVGDARYGGSRGVIPVERPFLHAYRLAFDHPATGERVSFEAPLPPDLQEVHGILG